MTAYTEQAPDDEEIDPADRPTFSREQRLKLVLIALAAYGYGWMITQTIGVFRDVGHGGSLLADPGGLFALVKVAIATVAIGGIATVAGRSIRPDVGVLAAAIALFAIRRTGGVTRDVYLAAPTGATLVKLAIETLVLAGVFYVIHRIVRQAVRDRWIADDAAIDGVHVETEAPGQRLLASVTVGLVILVAMSLLCRTDERMQVTGTLAASAFIAALCTVRFIPAMPSVYFWLAPFGVGVVSYVVTALTGKSMLLIGEPTGSLAALARALPLDYASAGVAGALYGYWVGRTMIPADDRLPAPAAAAPI